MVLWAIHKAGYQCSLGRLEHYLPLSVLGESDQISAGAFSKVTLCFQ